MVLDNSKYEELVQELCVVHDQSTKEDVGLD